MSQNVEEYLEAIYKLAEGDVPVGIPALAERLSISPVSANEMIRRLVREGLVVYVPYKGVTLTPEGEARALSILRRHRLWERFLVDMLGMPWEEAHEAACGLEHVSSPSLIDRLERFLGEPGTCPHGHAVPTAAGQIAACSGHPLSDLAAGDEGIILQVPEEEPGVLTYLSELGLRPGTVVVVENVAPFEGPLMLRVGGAVLALGRNLAARILVERR